MSKSKSNQVLHPKNPVLLKDVNIPKEKGQTRVLPDGSLLYREPLTYTEVPAVRLDDIRLRLVQEASNKISYRFPKKRGYEDTNVTAFVKRDYNYGPKRENRPDRLFQIEGNGAKGEEPNGYVMDGGRIVLDAFDHGLRNFGNQLPMYVSSELEGHDIEDYLRRNWEISMYDLVARAPNGYYKGKSETQKKKTRKDTKAREWHAGPPRCGTFSMRATRFRLSAGCLSWERKDGTAAKNKRILDIIPAQYKDPAVNSTKEWRDLNRAEIKKIKDGAMKKPQKGPKEKRAAQAKKEAEELQKNVEGDEEGGSQDGYFEYASGSGEAEEDNYVSPAFYDENTASFSTQQPSASTKPDSGLYLDGGMSFSKPPKRSREQESMVLGNFEEDLEARPSKQRKTQTLAHTSQGIGDDTNFMPDTRSRIRKPRHGRTSAPNPSATTEGSMTFSFAMNQRDLQDQGLHTLSPSTGFDPKVPALENIGQPFNTLGRNMQAHRSPKDLGSDEWHQTETGSPQILFGRDEAQNGDFQQLCPYPSEGFVGISQSIGFQAGISHVDPQVQGLEMSHPTNLLAGAKYANFQYSRPQDGFPQYGYPQHDLPHEIFPQDAFSLNGLPQTGLPQTAFSQASVPFEDLTHEGSSWKTPSKRFVHANAPGKESSRRMPPPANFIGKRQKNGYASRGQPKQNRVSKRARGSKTVLAPLPEIPLTNPKDSGYCSSQIESQDASFPQTESEFPASFPSHLPSAYGYCRNRGHSSAEKHGNLSGIDNDYGIFYGSAAGSSDGEPFPRAHDPIHIETDPTLGPDHDVHPAADFHRGQWDAIQAARSMCSDRDWVA